MPIEINILSGSRQGEQLQLDGEDIRVGDGAECDVRFSSEAHPAIRGHRAAVRLGPDGWQFCNLGKGEWIVGHSAIASQRSCPLRSGDIVRLSTDGPDFQFNVLARRRAIAKPLDLPRSAPATPDGRPSLPTDDTKVPDNSLTSSSRPSVTFAVNLPKPILIAGSVALVGGLILLAAQLIPRTSSTRQVVSGANKATPTEQVRNPGRQTPKS